MMYNAIVAKIHTRPHPNADRIQLGDVLGNQVVTSLDTQDGELGIYFPVDGILSVEFADHNQLLNKSARQQLGLPESEKTGFFDHHRRVRAQKFRGERSEGIWLPLQSLPDGGDSQLIFTLKEGDQFDTIAGKKICEKWVATTKGPSQPNSTRAVKRGELLGFPKHQDTNQWRHERQNIPDLSLITLTEKLHGTSHRFGLVPDPDRKWFQFWKPRYKRFDGTRNVVITPDNGRMSYYGTDQFRLDATQPITPLRKGEVIFGEIVGWVNDSTPIMPSVKVDKKELPEIHKQYGEMMHYHYGCQPGEAKFYVYRIVQFNEDGEGVELSWPQVTRRATALGFSVPKTIASLVLPNESEDVRELLNEEVEKDTEGSSFESLSQIREGLVARVDDPTGHTYFLKNKSFAFKLLEGIIKSAESYNDMEEAA